MPLVAWRFLSGCQRLAYSRLVLGTPFLATAVARVSNFVTRECNFKRLPCYPSIYRSFCRVRRRTIGEYNTDLTDATIHCDYQG
ncbi:MAG: hypothetical protein IKD35_05145 [Clostridia bacterium]|nr:hypothetical protein [Clostridia bacterium]